MATNIFNYAAGIDLDRRRTVFREVTASGYQRSRVNSPLFYYVNVTLRPCYRDVYRLVDNDIQAFQDGIATVRARIPHGITYAQGDWTAGTPVVMGADQTGMNVNISGLTNGSVLRQGDFIQFNSDSENDAGRYKVYQLTSLSLIHI